MEFKELEIKKEGSWLSRTFTGPHARRTIISILIGALAGFLYYYFTDGKHLDIIPLKDILKSTAIGGFFGLFITNSPCARGRC